MVLEGEEMTDVEKTIEYYERECRIRERAGMKANQCHCHQDLALEALREKAERMKGCHGCEHRGNYEDEIEYGYACPCLLCSRRSLDNYKPLKGGE